MSVIHHRAPIILRKNIEGISNKTYNTKNAARPVEMDRHISLLTRYGQSITRLTGIVQGIGHGDRLEHPGDFGVSDITTVQKGQ